MTPLPICSERSCPLSDGLILNYFEFLTDVPRSDLTDMARDLERDAVNPMDYKKRLAWDITNQFHGGQAAAAAQSQFERVVQGGGVPDEVPELSLESLRAQGVLSENSARADRLLVAASLASSNAEAKRLLGQGAVELIRWTGGQMTVSGDQPAVPVEPGDVVRVGKRRFVRLVGP